MKNKFLKIILLILLIVVSITIGFYFGMDLQPRSYLAIQDCKDNCWDLKEIAGILVSFGITKTPELIPEVLKETDMAIAIKHPRPQADIHYLIFPKKDIKDISDVTEEDKPYLLDVINITGELIRENNLKDYRLIVNGPGYQTVRYLHFHLFSQD